MRWFATLACGPGSEPGAPPSTAVEETDPAPTATTTSAGPLHEVTLTPHDVLTTVFVVEVQLAEDAIVWTSLTPEGLDPIDGPAVEGVAGERLRSPLLGAPAGFASSWVVHATTASGAFVTEPALVEPAPLPDVPAFVTTVWDPSAADDTRWVLVPVSTGALWSGAPWAVLVLDRLARPVWAWIGPTGSWIQYVQPSVSGDAVLIGDIPMKGTPGDAWVQTVRFDGRTVMERPIAGAHHPFVERPDGRLAWASHEDGRERLVVDDGNGATDVLWDSALWGHDIGDPGDAQSNALSYDPATDRYLVSLWNRDTIVEVDGTSGAVTRQFGVATGSYAFDPPDSAFHFQHGGHRLADGNVLLTSTVYGSPTFAREYAVDDAARTLREVWRSDADGAVAPQMGEAQRLPLGTTLMNFGTAGQIREVTPEGEVAWAVEPPFELAVGRMIPLPDLHAWWPAVW